MRRSADSAHTSDMRPFAGVAVSHLSLSQACFVMFHHSWRVLAHISALQDFAAVAFKAQATLTFYQFYHSTNRSESRADWRREQSRGGSTTPPPPPPPPGPKQRPGHLDLGRRSLDLKESRNLHLFRDTFSNSYRTSAIEAAESELGVFLRLPLLT